ncbi:glycosyltransferase [Shewanella sp. D64]|uniref:glycosyltransferase n=1 Tax=unclassified Shewanella TaxID=196818 RepID=UPI0022BA686B|nr:MULTISPECIES: glycosyltransferase [unclassified Shewanella]MEC4727481.1 glycosyltransferase [Shewanella sp. D64]MEC4738110.1 glycosyltransferase [Shewanella sp. E94]WBJ96376.1 glycosyltransferase [Shewanella sp. MTB7]
MRPRVIHLVDDNKLGGVNLALKSLCESKLARDFDFSVLNINFKFWLPKRFDADILIIHAAASWRKLPGFILLKLCNIGIPIFYQEHHYCEGFMTHESRNHWRFFLMLKLSYFLMKRVLAVSAAQGRWLLDNELIKVNKLAVLMQARPVDDLLSLPDKPFAFPLQLGAYGRLHKQKGFDLLMQAMSEIPPDKVELRLAGSGEMSAGLALMAAGLNNVTLVGEIEDVPLFLSSCDAVVIPSRWEPFGLICQESIVAGKVIVTTSVDGLLEQLLALPLERREGEDSSVFFTEQTKASLVQALENMIAKAERKSVKGDGVTSLSGLIYEERAVAAQRWPQLVKAWGNLLTSELEKEKSANRRFS